MQPDERPRSGTVARGVLSETRFPDLLTECEWAAVMRYLGLSRQQGEIARCAFYDERDHAIAQRLGRSSHTIHTQRIRLFRKLSVTSMAQAISVIASAYVLHQGATDIGKHVSSDATTPVA